MEITLYNAVSIDGYIARLNDDTSWVSQIDWKNFKKFTKQKRAIIMGRKTYEVSGDDFPYDCDLNVVMTNDQKLIKSSQDNKDNQRQVLFTDKSLKEVIQEIEEMDFKELLIIGGGRLNASFLKENLIDEIIIDIHPIILGQGIKLFEGEEIIKKLKLRSSRLLNQGLILNKYSVIN